MLIIYIIVYFISLVFWGFRLLHYFISRGVTELRFYCFDNVNFYNHQLALYFFINFFLKPYATAYLTYYLLLQFKKNGDFKQLVVHFLYNLIIRLFTGFTKQVIITSFKWTKGIIEIICDQRALNESIVVAFRILLSNNILRSLPIVGDNLRIYKTSDKTLNFNPKNLRPLKEQIELALIKYNLNRFEYGYSCLRGISDNNLTGISLNDFKFIGSTLPPHTSGFTKIIIDGTRYYYGVNFTHSKSTNGISNMNTIHDTYIVTPPVLYKGEDIQLSELKFSYRMDIRVPLNKLGILEDVLNVNLAVNESPLRTWDSNQNRLIIQKFTKHIQVLDNLSIEAQSELLKLKGWCNVNNIHKEELLTASFLKKCCSVESTLTEDDLTSILENINNKF